MFVLKATTQARKDLKRLKKISLKDFHLSKQFIQELLLNGFSGVPTKALQTNNYSIYTCFFTP